MHCGTRVHATKACKIKVLTVINKIARHKRAHTRVFSTRVCKVDIELYCINKLIFLYLKARRCKCYALNIMYIKLHKLAIMDKKLAKYTKI